MRTIALAHRGNAAERVGRLLTTSIVVLALVAVELLGGAAVASSATVMHCPAPAPGQGPKNDRSLPIGALVARNMSCSAARTAIRRGSFSVHGACFGIPSATPCRSSFKTPGFRCMAPTLGMFRCTAHLRRFSFGWGE